MAAKSIIRAYTISHKAWYADTRPVKTPHFFFGLYNAAGPGAEAELVMEWTPLRDEEDLCPVLKCFNEDFVAINSFPDVLQGLAAFEGKRFSPEEFKELLDKCGFTDQTPYTAESRHRLRATYHYDQIVEGEDDEHLRSRMEARANRKGQKTPIVRTQLG
jgi:hypothetical protein